VRVVTTFHPTEYLAARIAGDAARVECLAPPDEDPLFWEPKGEVLRDLVSADLIVLHGAGMDTWRAKVSLPTSRTVVVSDGLAEHLLEFGKALTHSHGAGAEHSHKGTDPHVWMDPKRLAVQARAVHAGLARVLSDGDRAGLDQRLASLLEDLDDLHGAWSALGSLPAGEYLYASHPAYDYLADRYGWALVNLDLDPEQVPTAETLEAIRVNLVRRPARFMMWEARPLPEVEEAVRTATGLESLWVSPCEQLTPEERAAGADFLSVQRGNVERLGIAFR
jgi:zinc transport system substrate-binding protein